MKAPVDQSPRDTRRRQRQISAYLSELRAAHAAEESRLRRMLGAASPKKRAGRRHRSTRPA